MRIDWPDLLGYDVFISYARAEASAYVPQPRSQLAAADLKCFLDLDEVPGGFSPTTPTISRALSKSRIFVLVGTSSALSRPWVQRELNYYGDSVDIVESSRSR